MLKKKNLSGAIICQIVTSYALTLPGRRAACGQQSDTRTGPERTLCIVQGTDGWAEDVNGNSPNTCPCSFLKRGPGRKERRCTSSPGQRLHQNSCFWVPWIRYKQSFWMPQNDPSSQTVAFLLRGTRKSSKIKGPAPRPPKALAFEEQGLGAAEVLQLSKPWVASRLMLLLCPP